MIRSARVRAMGRVAAVPAVVALAVLGATGTPVLAATPPSTGGQPGPEAWQPPPVNMGALPAVPPAGGAPEAGKNFQQDPNNPCITSGVGAAKLLDRPPAQDMLNIDQAQGFSTGQNVTVAVIDTGVNQHPFLNGRLINGGDYILGDHNALSDCDGHGTIVAGIIAADTRGKGVAFTGVAPDAKILAIKHTSQKYTNQSSGQKETAGDLQTLAEAIRFAASQPDVKVITMSVDLCLPIASEAASLQRSDARALQAAVHDAVNVENKVVIAAAGNLTVSNNPADQTGQQASSCQNVPQNANPNPNLVNQVQVPPVYADDVMSVGSVNPNTGAPSPFSVAGPWVTIAAPGEAITSIDPGPGGQGLVNQTIENGATVTLQGTSFAAPYVAGVAALVRSKYPNLTARQVMYRLEATAQHPSGPGGRNNEVGYGIVNPVAALTALIPGQNGVPNVTSNTIPAALPMPEVKDWTPIRVALIGTAAGATLLLVTLFVVRTVRRRAGER